MARFRRSSPPPGSLPTEILGGHGPKRGLAEALEVCGHHPCFQSDQLHLVDGGARGNSDSHPREREVLAPLRLAQTVQLRAPGIQRLLVVVWERCGDFLLEVAWLIVGEPHEVCVQGSPVISRGGQPRQDFGVVARGQQSCRIWRWPGLRAWTVPPSPRRGSGDPGWWVGTEKLFLETKWQSSLCVHKQRMYCYIINCSARPRPSSGESARNLDRMKVSGRRRDGSAVVLVLLPELLALPIPPTATNHSSSASSGTDTQRGGGGRELTRSILFCWSDTML